MFTCIFRATFFALAVLSASVVMAQTPPADLPPPDGPVDANIRKEVVETLAKEMEAAYVYADKGKQVAADLRGRLAKGEYDQFDRALPFARALTEQIQGPTGDKHLRVNFSERDVNVPPARREPTPQEVDEQRAFLRSINFGVEKIERLPGNIGYLDLRGFATAGLGGDTIVAAMNLLAHADALIIDLTQNGGGDPAAVALISSYLFDSRTHLNDLVMREEGKERVEHFWTTDSVSGARFGGKKPVYILTAKRTFSAAEEFTYNLKNLKRATVVGETTRGGAHPGRRFRLSKNFGAFIATGRARSPITQTNWEGTGVTPDVPATAEQALNVAQRLALKPLIEAEKNPRRKAAMEARLKTLEEEAKPGEAKK
ncbi:MAG: S41 family peptidase [Betaproteobacteria bacterium]|nr:S41 family peptidase [Betaproteobacteria bacterium]